MNKLQLISDDELRLRLARVYRGMADAGIDSMLVSDNANIYYLTGRVFSGYVFIHAGYPDPVYIVKRPVALEGDRVVYIRKPENIADTLASLSPAFTTAGTAIELDTLSYSSAIRLQKALGSTDARNASGILRAARAVKTPVQVAMMRESGERQRRVYETVPHVYQEGMTDIELQIEIERQARLEGCLGQFRISGDDMELYMGNVLTGDNADAPSPYDFAMGGAGLDPSLPVGANGSEIKPGQCVMVDMNGNFTGYMTDMTRCFSVGTLPDEAVRAHKVSVDICHALQDMCRPGVAAADLYHTAERMAAEAGLANCFMGHRQHAGFVGHGVGIEINELPVLAPRSRDIIAEGNTIAVEPKFVIPGCGAVGIENTLVVGASGTECITNAPERIISLV